MDSAFPGKLTFETYLNEVQFIFRGKPVRRGDEVTEEMRQELMRRHMLLNQISRPERAA